MSVHTPVMLERALECLVTDVQGNYLDGTYGRGGHSRELLRCLGEGAQLWVVDRDSEAIADAAELAAADIRVRVHHGLYADMGKLGVGGLHGVLLDLGISSAQLDSPERGFSFMRSAPLDMRMDTSGGQTAAEWLMAADVREIADVLHGFGGERRARVIARAIVRVRETGEINDTLQLAEIIRAHVRPSRHGIDAATRSFLAIRIRVNDELQTLHRGLESALETLRPGGRLVVISFHSGEDRIVKQFMRSHDQGESYSRDLPPQEHHRRLRTLGRWRPLSSETDHNPRARSAVLRAAEKLGQ